MFQKWLARVPDIDGLDFDLEGNDDHASPQNSYDEPTYRFMGLLSQALKRDGYRVTLVPPQSYMDVATSAFSLSVNEAYPEYEPAFNYHGLNTYSLVYAAYGTTQLADGSTTPTFDFVMVQLYETFSRAHEHIYALNESAAGYLVELVEAMEAGWFVDFAAEPSVASPSAVVALPRTRHVIGLANGWTDGSRALWIAPSDIADAVARLGVGRGPRGAMFWCIASEGVKRPGAPPSDPPVFLAPALGAIFGTR